MISLKHPFCNSSLGPPADMTEAECRTLHIYREGEFHGQPAVTSFWTPEPAELETLNSGGSVMLRILGHTHPPLSMRVSPPDDGAKPSDGYVPFVLTSDEFQTMAEEMENLREQLKRAEGEASEANRESALGVSIDNGELVIRIGINRIDGHDDHPVFPHLPITNIPAWAQEVADEMRREDTEGTTLLDILFDAAIAQALDKGSAAIDYKRPYKKPVFDVRTCRVCQCTDDDCSQCIEKTGQPCHWVDEDLCSACEKDAPPRNDDLPV